MPPLKGAAVQKTSASDSGDVSWKVPQTKFYYPANIPNISNHHWTAGVALATPIAHKGGVAGAKVLALSVIDCLEHPEAGGGGQGKFLEGTRRRLLSLCCCRPIRSRRFRSIAR